MGELYKYRRVGKWHHTKIYRLSIRTGRGKHFKRERNVVTLGLNKRMEYYEEDYLSREGAQHRHNIGIRGGDNGLKQNRVSYVNKRSNIE